MIIGVPKEIKTEEKRVAITPAGVSALNAHGHQVYIEKNAGVGSGITDEEYKAAGATILPKAAEVWGKAEMIMKVKEPQPVEYKFMKNKLIFTYLHLAAEKELTEAMVAANCIGIAYETIETAEHHLPLLSPMSEVAGKLAPQVGSWCLEAFAWQQFHPGAGE